MKIGSVRRAQTRVTLYQKALYRPNIPEDLNLAKAGLYLLVVPITLFFLWNSLAKTEGMMIVVYQEFMPHIACILVNQQLSVNRPMTEEPVSSIHVRVTGTPTYSF